VEEQTRDAVLKRLKSELRRRGDLLLLAPIIRNRKGFHTDVARWAFKHGFGELRADGKMYRTDKPFRLDRFREHDVEVVVGVMERRTRGEMAQREFVDKALQVGKGTLYALDNLAS
jgi:excinuclease ABC subunit A